MNIAKILKITIVSLFIGIISYQSIICSGKRGNICNIRMKSTLDKRQNDHLVKVPEGISKFQAFAALYNNAKILQSEGECVINSEKMIENSIEAQQLFFKECFSEDCDLVRGKMMKMDFSNYPNLDSRSYDKIYGKGKLKHIISNLQRDENYNVLSTHNDSCSIFSPAIVNKMSPADKEEFKQLISYCSAKNIAQDLENFRPWKLTDCKVNFKHQRNKFEYMDIPCQEATRFLERNIQADERNSIHTHIRDLQISGKRFFGIQNKTFKIDYIDLKNAQTVITKLDGDSNN